MRQQRAGDWGSVPMEFLAYKGIRILPDMFVPRSSPTLLPSRLGHLSMRQRLTFEQGQWRELLLVALIAELRRAV